MEVASAAGRSVEGLLVAAEASHSSLSTDTLIADSGTTLFTLTLLSLDELLVCFVERGLVDDDDDAFFI